MNKFNLVLRKCKTLSRHLIRTSSLRSKSTHGSPAELEATRIIWNTSAVCIYVGGEEEPRETVFVGSTRKRYVIASKHLSHPLVNALIEKSMPLDGNIAIKCEVVLFDHLLWMLENSNFNLACDSLDELTHLYSS